MNAKARTSVRTLVMIAMIVGTFRVSNARAETEKPPEAEMAALAGVVAEFMKKDPKTAQVDFEKLSPKMKEAVIEAHTLVKNVTTTTESAKGDAVTSGPTDWRSSVFTTSSGKNAPSAMLASGCRNVSTTTYSVNSVGTVGVEYHLRVDWCYNGSKVTSANRARWADIRMPLWQFAGNSSGWVRWESNSWTYSTWSQGKFTLLCGWSNCWQTQYLDAEALVYGNGAGSAW